MPTHCGKSLSSRSTRTESQRSGIHEFHSVSFDKIFLLIIIVIQCNTEFYALCRIIVPAERTLPRGGEADERDEVCFEERISSLYFTFLAGE